MSYEKLYKEALERARDMLSYKEVRQEDMEYIFPELKDDEDEIVKRTLIIKFKEWKLSGDEDETWYGLSYDSVIAWLEKQGEKPQGKSIIEAWKDMRLEVYQQASGNRHEPNYSDDSTKMFSLNDIDEIIEKINEQTEKIDNQNCVKPTDKVEPKFKVGDWVVLNGNHNSIYQVEKIDNYHYFLRHILGGAFSTPFGSENSMRLWTIEDAREGDILVSAYGSIFIYRSHTDIGVNEHCCLIDNRFKVFPKNNITFTDIKGTHPANKSQRDLLFAKMKDAGYEWDADKKELKKI